ncbi:MAG TPA: outer membrane beta-barrel protein [Gallionellaceae bacterium]|nr:outer membrane beta-barrel protein [Gallionellaceae bacterium]
MLNPKLLNPKLLVAALTALFAVPAFADPAPAAPAGPTLSSVLDASGISLSGDIDVSYNHLSGAGKFTSGTNDRVFDYAPNSFTTQAVDLTVSKLPAEGFGGLVDVTLGKDASTIASFGTASPGQTYDLTQAYVQYATGSYTTIAGKFATLAGEEVIKASGNTNFSRSILFGYAIPFTHTGVRETYKISDAVSLIGGVNNGWDQATDTNANKTIELGAALNPTKSFALTAQDYYGTEQVAGTPFGAQGKRNLLDLVATYTVSDSLNFVLNPDFGSQENATLANGSTGSAKWSGMAAYANYQINDPWRVSVRAEYFNDKDGYRTGIAQKWKEATLTVGYAASKNTELRGEIRKDTSDQASFAYNDGIARKSQDSVGLEAVYKF